MKLTHKETMLVDIVPPAIQVLAPARSRGWDGQTANEVGKTAIQLASVVDFEATARDLVNEHLIPLIE